jgi:hypothetical protein
MTAAWTLVNEREREHGWEYDARFMAPAGECRTVLRLSWADYQHWSPDGSVPPSRVAEAVLGVVAAWPDLFAGLERIDAATVRRRLPDGHRLIEARLHQDP